MRLYLRVAIVFLALAAPAAASEVLPDLPATIDTANRYLFYLHGFGPELRGPDFYSRDFGKTYETTAIARTLAERGFVVITEVRPKGTQIPGYAKKLAAQVRQLLAAGVPPRNIMVLGHSKGGFITIMAARMIASPDVSFAVLAGCPLPDTHNTAGNDARAGYERIIQGTKGQLMGRVLSVYDVADSWMGTCHDVFSANPQLTTREVVLQTGQPPGKGHGLFYAPDKTWIDVVIRWIDE